MERGYRHVDSEGVGEHSYYPQALSVVELELAL
jgi:hypothetical protein